MAFVNLVGASVRDPLHRSAMKGQADVNVKTTTKATSVTLAGKSYTDQKRAVYHVTVTLITPLTTYVMMSLGSVSV